LILDLLLPALFKYLIKVNNQIHLGGHNDQAVGDQWTPLKIG